MPRKKTLLPIGIHLNPESVHMVQLEQADSMVALVSRASHEFPPLPASDGEGEPGDGAGAVHNEAREARYQEVYQFARQTLASDGFRGTEAVISLPADCLIIQHVRMAPMQPEELSGALVWELQKKLPYDPKEAVIRHILAGTVSENNERMQDVIALAAPGLGGETRGRHVAHRASGRRGQRGAVRDVLSLRVCRHALDGFAGWAPEPHDRAARRAEDPRGHRPGAGDDLRQGR